MDEVEAQAAADECVRRSVHDAVLQSERGRVSGTEVTMDDALDTLWAAWDSHVPDLPSPVARRALKLAERCVRHYCVHAGRAWGEPAAVGVSEQMDVDGVVRDVRIDEVLRRGNTAVVVFFVVDESDMPEDPGRSAVSDTAARWALRNVDGAYAVMCRWEVLSEGRAVEMPVEIDVRPHREAPPPPKEEEPPALSDEEVASIIDGYAELQEKIDALTSRREDLLQRQRDLAERLAPMLKDGKRELSGHGVDAVATIRRDVTLPEDKSAVAERLKAIGRYDEFATVNWSKLRAEVAKGEGDPEIAKASTVKESVRVKIRGQKRPSGTCDGQGRRGRPRRRL